MHVVGLKMNIIHYTSFIRVLPLLWWWWWLLYSVRTGDCSHILIFIVDSCCWFHPHEIEGNVDNCERLEILLSYVEGRSFWDWDTAGHWTLSQVFFHLQAHKLSSNLDPIFSWCWWQKHKSQFFVLFFLAQIPLWETILILRELVLKWTSSFFFVSVMFELCLQHHITYNSVSRSMSREREMERKDMDTPPGRSKEKKEEKDRKDRKRVSPPHTGFPFSRCLWSARLKYLLSHRFTFRTTTSTTARWAWKPSGRRTRTEPVRLLSATPWARPALQGMPLNLLVSPPPLQTPSKTARAPVLRATLRCQWRRRRARGPNLPARRRPICWNPSERPRRPKRWISGSAVSPRIMSRSAEVRWGLLVPEQEHLKLHSVPFCLFCVRRSPDTTRRRRRSGTAAEERRRKSNILDAAWHVSNITLFALFGFWSPSSVFGGHSPVRRCSRCLIAFGAQPAPPACEHISTPIVTEPLGLSNLSPASFPLWVAAAPRWSVDVWWEPGRLSVGFPIALC